MYQRFDAMTARDLADALMTAVDGDSDADLTPDVVRDALDAVPGSARPVRAALRVPSFDAEAAREAGLAAARPDRSETARRSAVDKIFGGADDDE